MPSRSAILTYHSLDASGSVLSTSPDAFARQMAWLASSGVPVVPLAGATTTPGALALTFDDGFRNFRTEALPILERHGFPATLFVVSGFCGRTNRWPGQSRDVPELPLLDWDELKDVSTRGVSLGAHSVNHPRLPGLPAADAEREIERSRVEIEDRIGVRVDAFAYPYGQSTPALRRFVEQHFHIGCGTRLQLLGADEPSDLPRIDAYYLRQPHWFERLMTPGGHAYVWARRLGRGVRACVFPS